MSAGGRPRLLLSACLLGEPVRYDGGHRHAPQLVEALAAFAELLPLCPEAGAGLGVPRPPVDLYRRADGVHMLGVDDRSFDPTARVYRWCQEQLPLLGTIDGCVLKARSPSCGIGNVPLREPEGRVVAADGLFAGLVREHFPDLPLADEEALGDPRGLADFCQRVEAHRALRVV